MGLKIAMAQINPTVGDLDANTNKIKKFYESAKKAKLDLLVFGELALCGYPPEDLLLKKTFLNENKKALEKIAAECCDITMLIGFAEQGSQKPYNSMAVLKNGKIAKIYRKALLPNYGVFDEKRYFAEGSEPLAVEINGKSIICTICEDIWDTEWLRFFLEPVTKKDLIINISASPFHAGKIHEKIKVLQKCAKTIGCPVGYCNIVGGQDELVFDGRSMLLDSDGKLSACAKDFQEDLLVTQLNDDNSIQTLPVSLKDDYIEEIYKALVLGTKDYITKNGFKKVLIGISGGIDSALTAAIAADALGAENVIGVTMPTKFNSTETISDSGKLAASLGIEFHSVPIENILAGFDNELKNISGWDDKGLAFENLQARIRGTILMSLSNQFGAMVLTTGNKSETAVGYSTLYGDTAGGFAVIKDLPKTAVYKLCEYINQTNAREVIPQSIITRTPSAELRPNQKDSDSLGDYETLDAILKGYIEEEKSLAELVEQGFDGKTVLKIIKMVDRNEYKRRQCPPGVKITPKAFGKDRRMPITNRYQQKIKQ